MPEIVPPSWFFPVLWLAVIVFAVLSLFVLAVLVLGWVQDKLDPKNAGRIPATWIDKDYNK